uniref:AMMECR1 domain-containing protein n=1 Tax=Gadus morhua TaxID=8049 RepID=A0A8C5CCM3_GADMO
MARKRYVGADCSKMAAGCCGVKEQKLPGSPGSGSSVGQTWGSVDRGDSTAVLSPTPASYNLSGLSPNLSEGRSGVTIIISRINYSFCPSVLHASMLHYLKLRQRTPLFVTWKIGRDKWLRGCIGTFSAMNLHSGLREYTLTSLGNALKDSRFPPVTRDELARLFCSMSLLINFEDVRDYLDWEVSTGLIIVAYSNGLFLYMTPAPLGHSNNSPYPYGVGGRGCLWTVEVHQT